jgi:uncharacterized protein YbjQ (UPF0145 family)
MKKWTALVILGAALAVTLPAHARNVKYMLPIAAALEDGKLDGSVKLYFGTQAAPAAAQKFANITSNGKGLIQDRSDLGACKAAFAEALQGLLQNAKGIGANAIVNIASSFKKGPQTTSAAEFECHAGTSTAHVTLTGDIIKTADK